MTLEEFRRRMALLSGRDNIMAFLDSIPKRELNELKVEAERRGETLLTGSAFEDIEEDIFAPEEEEITADRKSKDELNRFKTNVLKGFDKGIVVNNNAVNFRSEIKKPDGSVEVKNVADMSETLEDMQNGFYVTKGDINEFLANLKKQVDADIESGKIDNPKKYAKYLTLTGVDGKSVTGKLTSKGFSKKFIKELNEMVSSQAQIVLGKSSELADGSTAMEIKNRLLSGRGISSKAKIDDSVKESHMQEDKETTYFGLKNYALSDTDPKAKKPRAITKEDVSKAEVPKKVKKFNVPKSVKIAGLVAAGVVTTAAFGYAAPLVLPMIEGVAVGSPAFVQPLLYGVSQAFTLANNVVPGAVAATSTLAESSMLTSPLSYLASYAGTAGTLIGSTLLDKELGGAILNKVKESKIVKAVGSGIEKVGEGIASIGEFVRDGGAEPCHEI